MEYIESIIRKLVRTHEFVIIPGFGALLSHEVVASFDSKKGKFIPSSRKLSFNEFVSQDDGFLANYISQADQISHAAALAQIKNFATELKVKLQKTGATGIEGVGTFRANVEGKLIFEPDYTQFIQDDWYGFHDIKAVELKKGPVEVFTTVVSDTEYVQQENGVSKKALRWYHWASAAMVVGLLCYFSFFMVSGNQPVNKSDLNPFRSAVQEDDKNKAVERSDISQNVVAKQANMEVIDSVVSETPIEEAEVIRELERTDILEKDPFEYYLIAGAFRGQKQAGILVEEMRKKGYPMTKIIPADQHSSKFKVAVQGFVDKASANAANRQLKEVIGAYGWVYHQR